MSTSHAQSRHQLVRLSIVGGFLDGQSFDFASAMNCVIGARGTGNTTVLKFTRWAMDALPSDLTERRRIEELVSRNLKGGRVDLTVRTKDGLTYIVSRSPDDEPIVKTAEDKVTDLSVSGGGLFRISVFSQNEVEQIADRTATQLDLFEPEHINEFGRQMEASRHQLELNASQMKPLRERLAQMGEEVKGGEAVDERLGAFGAEGGDSADTINQAHALKSLRDREARALKGAKDLVGEVGKSMKAMVGNMSARGHRERRVDRHRLEMAIVTRRARYLDQSDREQLVPVLDFRVVLDFRLPMNFPPGRVSADGGHVVDGGPQVALHMAHRQALPAMVGRDNLLGVRPEHLSHVRFPAGRADLHPLRRPGARDRKHG